MGRIKQLQGEIMVILSPGGRNMKRAGLIAFLLISFLLICPNFSQAALKLYVEDEEVQLKHDLVMINGNYMIPLWVFAEHLDAEIQVDDTRFQIIFADQTIEMQLGAETALVDGREYILEVGPQLVQGEIIVPLRFMADQRHLSLAFVQELNGFRLARKSPRFSGLGSLLVAEAPSSSPLAQEEGEAGPQGPEEPAEPEVPKEETSIVVYEPSEERGLREFVFLGGPRTRVFLDLESYSGYQTYLLEQPARLVVCL
ncbi:MAG TPA: hypothetical protein DDX25_10695 [Firmicutes bacterium]|nr:hypothetical protein [Bacillota bacterium]